MCFVAVMWAARCVEAMLAAEFEKLAVERTGADRSLKGLEVEAPEVVMSPWAESTVQDLMLKTDHPLKEL
jgi:hypothetical protein